MHFRNNNNNNNTKSEVGYMYINTFVRHTQKNQRVRCVVEASSFWQCLYRINISFRPLTDT